MSELSMLIYPWDVQADGAERIVDEVASLGVTRLEIATAYHSAEVLSPRRTDRVFTRAEANTVHLPLPDGTFSGLSAIPSSIAVNDPGLYPALKVAADAAGIGLTGWGIAFHNTRLAVEHPEAAILDCFGDRFTHGLCATNPAARAYALELFHGIAGTGLFDRVLAESVSYLLQGHGHPHELWGARLDVTTRYLLSLCFCEHCVAAAADRGIDAEPLRRRIAAELHRTWNAAYPAGRTPDAGTDLASLLVAWPDLAAYTRMRLDVVTSLVADLAAKVHASDVELSLSAAVWGRPAPMNWLEGVDIPASLGLVDGFVLESYFPSAQEVAAELDHALALAAPVEDPATVSVALTLWRAHHSSRADFATKVETVLAAGIDRIALYNYGTATSETLDWAREAAALLGGRP
jgi:hypothetical protein